MLTSEGPFWYRGRRWMPTVCYLLPTVVVVAEAQPRYWRIGVRWLWWEFSMEWGEAQP